MASSTGTILPTTCLIDRFDAFLRASRQITSIQIKDEFAAAYAKSPPKIPSNLIHLCATEVDRIAREHNGNLDQDRVKDLSAALAIAEIITIDLNDDRKVQRSKQILEGLGRELKAACEAKRAEDEATQKTKDQIATGKTAASLGVATLGALAIGTSSFLPPVALVGGLAYALYSRLPSSINQEIKAILGALDLEFPVSDSDSESEPTPLGIIVEAGENPQPAAAAAVPEASQIKFPPMDLAQYKASLHDKDLEEKIDRLAQAIRLMSVSFYVFPKSN